MNATPNIPQKASVPHVTPALPVQVTDIKPTSREFERLFQGATFRDAILEKPSEDNDELIGQALDWRQPVNAQISGDMVEKATAGANSPRTDQPNSKVESTKQGSERPEAKPEVKEDKVIAKSDKADDVKNEKESRTNSTDNKKSPRNDVPSSQTKQENNGVKAVKLESTPSVQADGEVLDLKEPGEIDAEVSELTDAEVPENSETQIEADLEPDLNPEADPGLGDETDLELPTEELEIEGEEKVDPEDLDLEQTQRQNPADAKKLKRGQVLPVLGDKGNIDEKPAPNGTNNAPRQPNMFTEAKTIQTAEKLGSTVSVEPETQLGGEDASGQRSGAGSDLARDHSTETAQPTLNVQGVAATGQSSAIFANQSVQVSSVLEAIWTRVTQFRTRGDSQWSVQIRPDDNTKLELTIKIGTAGLEIQTRMQQGDMGRLMSSWGELQQALSERGVSLKDLETDENFKEALAGGSDAMDQDQASPQSNEHEAEGGGELNLNNWQSKPEAEEPVQTAARTTSNHNGWESWA